MPTPRPISSDNSLENEAISIEFDSSPTSAIPIPSDAPAVSSGSSVASSEPNTRNSTTAAAAKPIWSPAVELWGSAFSAIPPPTWNWTPPPDARVTSETNDFDSRSETLPESTSKFTFAKAIRPDGAICSAPLAPS